MYPVFTNQFRSVLVGALLGPVVFLVALGNNSPTYADDPSGAPTVDAKWSLAPESGEAVLSLTNRGDKPIKVSRNVNVYYSNSDLNAAAKYFDSTRSGIIGASVLFIGPSIADVPPRPRGEGPPPKPAEVGPGETVEIKFSEDGFKAFASSNSTSKAYFYLSINKQIFNTSTMLNVDRKWVQR